LIQATVENGFGAQRLTNHHCGAPMAVFDKEMNAFGGPQWTFSDFPKLMHPTVYRT
jgi:hypothetical protein